MFRFKQFSVNDEASSMKVGTDAVLLGAWVGLDSAFKLLDVGTGCGIIALMVTQRSGAFVDAVDIDEASVSEARQNFAGSPWQERLHALLVNFIDFAATGSQKYDHIISNPPYFHRSLKAPDPVRCKARHDDELPAPGFFASSLKLLAPGGKISLVLPSAAFPVWKQEADQHQLHCIRATSVISKEGKVPYRLLATFGCGSFGLNADTLTIHRADGTFTDQYRNLTKDFYLAF